MVSGMWFLGSRNDINLKMTKGWSRGFGDVETSSVYGTCTPMYHLAHKGEPKEAQCRDEVYSAVQDARKLHICYIASCLVSNPKRGWFVLLFVRAEHCYNLFYNGAV